MTEGPTQEQQQAMFAALTQPHPIPAAVHVLDAAMDADKFVVLRVDDATGTRFTFLAPDAALEIAEKIRVTARNSKSGLIVPSGVSGLVGPR